MGSRAGFIQVRSTCSSISLGSLENEARRLVEGSLSNSTRAIYRRGVDNFDNFRDQLGVTQCWPAPVAHVIAFVSHMSLSGRAPSTINTYTSAIAFVHKINGWCDPTSNFIVKKLREGCKRLKGLPDSRRPVTIPILQRLCSDVFCLCDSTFEATMFKAVFLLAFFWFSGRRGVYGPV